MSQLLRTSSGVSRGRVIPQYSNAAWRHADRRPDGRGGAGAGGLGGNTGDAAETRPGGGYPDSGIVSGILLSRFISGAIADIAGWRGNRCLTAACLMLMIAGIVWKIMPSPPQRPQPQKPTYLSLLKSVFQLYLTERN